MVRIIAIAVLVYLLYRWLKPKKTVRPTVDETKNNKSETAQVEDIMVQDPQCEVWFPRSAAVTARVDGKRLMFCSDDCKDKYLKKWKAK